MPERMHDIRVGGTITLGQLLKLTGLVQSGGEAKQLIASGLVKVNGEVEIRRGRKMEEKDVVEVSGQSFLVSGE